MITKEQLISGEKKLFIKVLVNGGFGTGKTFFSMTFPKWAYAMIEPNGIMTAMSNPDLIKNMVYYDSFVPSNDEKILDTFNRLTAFIKKVREDAISGKIEAFILDNISHLSENRWLYINDVQKNMFLTDKSKVDTRSMYGELGRWLYRFTVLDLVSLPCHVIVPVHEKDEEKEEGGKMVLTGKVISNILGGFRKDVSGLFNASIFLETVKGGDGKYKYRARCLPGAGKQAKNNLGLPEIVENISYQSIINNLPKHTQSEKQTAGK